MYARREWTFLPQNRPFLSVDRWKTTYFRPSVVRFLGMDDSFTRRERRFADIPTMRRQSTRRERRYDDTNNPFADGDLFSPSENTKRPTYSPYATTFSPSERHEKTHFRRFADYFRPVEKRQFDDIPTTRRHSRLSESTEKTYATPYSSDMSSANILTASSSCM